MYRYNITENGDTNHQNKNCSYGVSGSVNLKHIKEAFLLRSLPTSTLLLRNQRWITGNSTWLPVFTLLATTQWTSVASISVNHTAGQRLAAWGAACGYTEIGKIYIIYLNLPSNEWQEDATASIDLDDEGPRLQPFVVVRLNDNAIDARLSETRVRTPPEVAILHAG